MRKVLFAGLFLAYAASAVALPLSNWNLNLGAIGGTNATAITDVTLNGFSQVDQTISANTSYGNPFTFSGSLGWVQYQAGGMPLSFGLPASYTDMFFRFSGLTGTVDNFGNATLLPDVGSITLYLDHGGSLIPSASALTLATFALDTGSNAQDIAYYDGFGANAFYTLNFRVVSALSGLLTDDRGNPILPGADFVTTVDGLLDLSVLDNPSAVPSGDGMSVSLLVNAGDMGAVNVQATPHGIPEPGTLFLVALGVMGIVTWQVARPPQSLR